MDRQVLASPNVFTGILSTAFLALVGCQGPGGEPGPGTETFLDDPFQITSGLFTVEGDLGPFTSRLHLEEVAPDVYELRVGITAPQPAEPPEFRIRWSLPASDIAGFWNTNLGLDRVNYYRNSIQTRATSGAPLLSHYNPGEMNRITVQVADALNPVGMSSRVREEDARFYFTITLCGERMPATTSYQTTVRIDARGIPYHQALAEATDWWAALPSYTPAPVPEGALLPVYSTWYSFHQTLDVEEVMAELRLAAEMGYEVVIVDDGWQTMDSQRGYRYTSDWKPERIPDMKGFVDAVHDAPDVRARGFLDLGVVEVGSLGVQPDGLEDEEVAVGPDGLVAVAGRSPEPDRVGAHLGHLGHVPIDAGL